MILPGGTLWWTDATAPWGATGAIGVAIAQQIAMNLGGTIMVEDGT